ncbi:lysine--tRNA ligase [Corynebacterium sp. 13CS0277]|nr:lysine--tRNA ligase [Corynebacterium sp. 13CS0277]
MYFYVTALFVFFDHLLGSTRLFATIAGIASFVLPLQGESLLTALVTAVIAHALSRLKRVGWWIAVIYLSFEVFVVAVALASFAANAYELRGIVSTVDMVRIVVAGAVQTLFLVALLLKRKLFHARLAEKSLRHTLLTLAVGTAVTWVLAVITAIVSYPNSTERPSAGELVNHFLTGTRAVNHWPDTVVAIGFSATVVVALIVLMRSQTTMQFTDLSSELVLRNLLRAGDESGQSDSLGYFATRRDKGCVFGPEHRAAVTFRSLAGVCLASGDPVGPKDHWPGAVEAFLRHAADKGLAPAVVGASKEGAEAYAAKGLKARVIGDEAVLLVDRFDINSPKLKAVRHAVNRVRAAGYEVRVRRHRDIHPEEMSRLIELADTWRQNGDDRGFSMALNRLGDPLDGDCVVVEALDATGQPRGLLSFVPWGRHGLSLDVMRRDTTHAENGVTEFMVTGLVEKSRELGVQRISLNFAALREVIAAGEDVGATFLQRLSRGAVSAVSRRFQIEQLYRSNLKYDPEWVPRYLCWRDTSDLATIGLAIGVAEGQISLPFVKDTAHEQPLYDADDERIAEFLTQNQVALAPRRLPQQVRQRMDARQALLDAGAEAYPAHFDRTSTLTQAMDAAPGTPVATAGRIVGVSDHGGVIFFRVQDWAGAAQIICERDTLGAAEMTRLRHTLALGDHIGVTGTRGASRTGTPSILATTVELTSKSLRPLPNLYRGISNEETKVRQRYLDLIVNQDARRQVEARSAVIQALRDTLLGEHFLEVETPLLQTIHGGANARPFKTHINAYDLGLYLRIAPELYLKRLMVGGVDRVFEIGRNFRNEGADATHNPEFTMLEAYQAYGDYTTMRELTRTLIINAALAANGTTLVRGRGHDGALHEVDLAAPWRVVTVHQGIAEATGRDITPDTPIEELRALAAEHDIHVDPQATRGAIIIELHEELAEKYAIAPTFFCDFPTDVSPLTRQHRDDPRVAEKWDLICFGAEVATAYSELIDPVIQRQRLVEQSLLAAGGDPEAMEVDEDFLLALEYTMPPSGGMGMGVDRLVMMLTEKNIRETIIFPLVKPQHGTTQAN